MAGARRMWHILSAVALLVLGTACAGEDPPDRISGRTDSAAVGSPSPTASAAGPAVTTAPARRPGAATSAGVVLAVARASGPLTLYRLAPGSRTATRLRELEGPSAETAIDISLSAGAEPTVCATWTPGLGASRDGLDFVSKLLCYAPGRRFGTEVTVEGDDPVNVAVRPDGRAVAWSTYAPEENGRIDVGRLDGAAVSEVRGFLYDPSRPEGPSSFTGASVASLGWLDDDELAIGQSNQSDDGSGLRRFSVAAGQKGGWGDADVVEPLEAEQARGYAVYDSVVGPAEDGSVLAVQRGYGLAQDDDPPAGRAVRMELATGKVLEVVAFPREGRHVAAVSGSRRAALYVTRADDGTDTVVSVRHRGESRGAPVRGLPSDVDLAVAQP